MTGYTSETAGPEQNPLLTLLFRIFNVMIRIRFYVLFMLVNGS
jgi:hypothetical protein